jgi:uncharacterized protein YsxB (DUF464 family)
MRVLGTQRDHFADEQNFPISRAQLTDEDLEYGKKMRDSLKLELENLRAQYQDKVIQLKDEVRNVKTQCNQFICERRVLITKTQLIDEDLEAVKKMRNSLKLGIENLRAQYQEEVTQLEDQLRNVRTQCEQFICE